MTKLLEEDSKEMAHMNSEANWRFEQYTKKLNEKSEVLKQLNVELQEVKHISYSKFNFAFGCSVEEKKCTL